ncbi:hypothetical protein FO519_009304 [Halicephalobus sp. NKZ332]|nr:hypothetical protein FO519_009304 [Halicephalobus sp. NKZ332]
MSKTELCADMSDVSEVCDLIINAATHLNITKNISVPRIVVVGTESTGKTSLINRIVNKDFLPSGTGIVTRMPINIEVKHRDWAEIDQDPKIYIDFNEVSNRLRGIMNEQAGAGVINRPIGIRIYSESALNLSLVDLPGLVINKIGNQAENIPGQIENMVIDYISDPNTIILCVLPANVPESNWKAWQVVHNVDPSGERTIAALTHIDAMVEGDSADEKLSGKNINFKLGIVGICNRSQKQLDNGTSIDKTAQLEQYYFNKNYPDFANKCGIKYLIKRMNELLVKEIKNDLPRLMIALKNDVEEIERKLSELGVQEDVKQEEHWEKLFQIISDFSKEYEKLIYGGHSILDNDEEAPCKKIFDILHIDFECELRIDHTQNLKPDRVKGWINNATGLTPKILLSSAPFIEACEIEIQRYCRPSVDCAKRVHTELRNGINSCTRNVKSVFKMYPQIKERFCDIIDKLLSDYFQESKNLIEVYIESLASHISIAHPLFANAVEAESKKIRDGSGTLDKGNENSEVVNDPENNLFHQVEQQRNKQKELTLDEATRLIISLVPKYMSIVRRNILDTVPAFIIYNMNRKMQKKLSPTLNLRFRELTDIELKDLFLEDEQIAIMRQQLDSQKKEWNNIIDKINGILNKGLD